MNQSLGLVKYNKTTCSNLSKLITSYMFLWSPVVGSFLIVLFLIIRCPPVFSLEMTRRLCRRTISEDVPAKSFV